jgi:hypothetical protein
MEQWSNHADRGKPKDSQKNLASATLPNKNTIPTAVATNRNLHGERTVNDDLSYGTAEVYSLNKSAESTFSSCQNSITSSRIIPLQQIVFKSNLPDKFQWKHETVQGLA